MPLQKQFLLFLGFIFSTLFSVAQAQSDMTPPSENDNITYSKSINNSRIAAVSITDSVINYGKQFLNKPYRYGSAGADSFDCSGFTSYVYRNFGYQLKHSSTDQANQFDTVKRTHLKTGDLVYFAGSRKSKRIGHVGIVVNAKEDGKFDFIHASCDHGITISSSEEPYYSRRFVKANRVIGGTQLMTSMPSIEDSPEFSDQSEIDVPLTTPAKRIKKTIPAKFHTVKSGETLSEIAEKYGISVAELKRKNHIDGSKLSLKQKLKVKDAESFTVAEPIQTANTISENASSDNNPAVLETSNEPVTYTVKKGETLFSISKSKHISIDDLKKINDIKDGKLRPGQELKLSLNSATSANNTLAKTDNPVKTINHKVVSGESLFSIAKMYNVSVDEIRKSNAISANGIHAGQVLKFTSSELNETKTNVAANTAKEEPKIAAKAEPTVKQEMVAKAPVKAESRPEMKTAARSDARVEAKYEAASRPLTSSKVIVHKVHSGENLMTIARDFKVSLDELKKINKLDGTKVSVGQDILIYFNPEAVVVNPVIITTPTPSTPAVSKVQESKPVVAAVKEKELAPKVEQKQKITLHKVKRGENLNSIAREFNVSIDELKEINHLTSNKISVGQKLKIGEPSVAISQKESVVTKPIANKPEFIAKSTVYKVKKGDNLNSIAREFNVTSDELKEVNNLASNKVSVGQKLRIVGAVVATAKEPVDKSEPVTKPAVYKVRKGDNLDAIAHKFNVTVDELKEANNLSSNKVSVGKKLKIAEVGVASTTKESVAKPETKKEKVQTIESETKAPTKSEAYKVKKGESLLVIAHKFNLSVDELKEINGLSDSKIHAGQELQVSKHAEEATKSQKPKADSPKPITEGKLKTTHHTVKSGESYYTIAEKYDCSVNDLKEWNNKSGNKIKPGDVLTIKTKKK